MAIEFLSRLPAIEFRAENPATPGVLPRMDVAAFVGFARCGPLHCPVPIEDAEQFEEIFGGDLPLAWDARRGERATAHLGPAVRSFFRNGGTRCRVVRVAGADDESAPSLARFGVPGLLRCRTDSAGQVLTEPAFATARSEGSWADDLEIGAAITTEGFELAALETPAAGAGRVATLASATSTLRVGDLVRLRDGGPSEEWCVIARVERPPRTAGPGAAARHRLHLEHVARVDRLLASAIPPGPAAAQRLDPGAPSFPAEVEAPDTKSRPAPAPGADVLLRIDAADADAPAVGEILGVDSGGTCFLASVLSVERAANARAGTAAAWFAWTRCFTLAAAPAAFAATPRLDRVELSLECREGPRARHRLDGLGFDRRHARYWNALPLDRELYAAHASYEARNPGPDAERHGARWREYNRHDPERDPRTRYGPLWDEASHPRFAFAGGSPAEGVCLPIGLAQPGVLAHGRVVERGESAPLVRDGLGEFSAAVFVDPALAAVPASQLLAEAEYLRFGQPVPRALRGVHAALALDEVTLVAAPDAVHGGWHAVAALPLPAPVDFPPRLHPEWWRWMDCPERFVARHEERPPRGRFLGCGVALPERPWLDAPRERLAGEIEVSWAWPPPASGAPASVAPPDAEFVVEMSHDVVALETGPGAPPLHEMVDPCEVYRGSERSTVLRARPAGLYWFRVRAEAGGQSSHWSQGRAVRVGDLPGWEMNAAAAPGDRAALLAAAAACESVHRCLLSVCSARGDLFAVLALPEGFREDEALRHAQSLGAASAETRSAPLSPEGWSLSHGALFHPWVREGERGAASATRRMPADGAVTGLLARRAIERGAWISPANEPLRGVLGLGPGPDPARLLDLQQGRVNAILGGPRGFVLQNDLTLSPDADLAPISVRRLLHLLRRLALREGHRFAFEPLDDVLRRAIQREFEAALETLFQRKAFAGATRAESYRVRVDEAVNPAPSLDLGRFVVELRVAPSLPMRFLTVRLLQTGDQGQRVEGA